MTDQTSPEAAPVRVPNVSANARSGLDHEVIGSNAQAAYDENDRLASLNPTVDPDDVTVPHVGNDGAGGAPEIPEDLTTVDALLDWVAEPEDEDEQDARARAVLAAENDKPEDDRRVTLVEPLERHLAAAEGSDEPPA